MRHSPLAVLVLVLAAGPLHCVTRDKSGPTVEGADRGAARTEIPISELGERAGEIIGSMDRLADAPIQDVHGTGERLAEMSAAAVLPADGAAVDPRGGPPASAEAPKTPSRAVRERIASMKGLFDRIDVEVSKGIVEQKEVLDSVWETLLSGGNIVLEGVPGTAKTKMAEVVAHVTGLKVQLIPMTPDLTPADLIGSRVYDPTKGEWSIVKGPMILGNIVILDELNRGQPKTKSAALRPMQEHQAKIFDQVFKQEDGSFPKPYMVIATMNPLDSEGVSPLVEAEKDRFQRHKRVKYLSFAGELEVGDRESSVYRPTIEVLLSRERILELQNLVRQVYISPLLKSYITMVVRSTRPTREEDGTDNQVLDLDGVVKVGAGNRGTYNTMLAAKARALRRGSWKVELSDILDVIHDTLRMRIILDPTAVSRGQRADKIVDAALAEIDPADPTASLRAAVPSPEASAAKAALGPWARLRGALMNLWERL